MPDNFVHLHVHTEYSMLDGAAKNGKLIAEVERQGMPAVAMSDHGNMFGAYEFHQLASEHGGASRSSASRRTSLPTPGYDKKQVFWAPGGAAQRESPTAKAARTSPAAAATRT